MSAPRFHVMLLCAALLAVTPGCILFDDVDIFPDMSQPAPQDMPPVVDALADLPPDVAPDLPPDMTPDLPEDMPSELDETSDTPEDLPQDMPPDCQGITCGKTLVALPPLELGIAQRAALVAQLEDMGGDRMRAQVTWTSSDETVAKVQGDVLRGERAGTARITARVEELTTSFDVIVSSGFEDVTIAATHACATHDTGPAHCWGIGTDGQLGEGHRYDTLWPVPIRGSMLGSVAAGMHHTCGLNETELFCWGDHDQRQLGITSTISEVLEPQPVMSASWRQLTIGHRHGCAVAEGGPVWCWGDNAQGQAGGADAVVAPPEQVRDLVARQVSAGGAHTCAIDRQGFLWCWGDNAQGQCGQDTQGAPVTTPTQLSDDLYLEVTAGARHTCAITREGELRCWGANDLGQLGREKDMPQSASDPLEVALPAGVTPRWLSQGAGDHTCVIAEDASLWCWGENASGQLGHTAPTPAPAEVLGDLEVSRVSTGASGTCAITRAGTLHCWGDNAQGQLGQGTTVASALPRPVTFPRSLLAPYAPSSTFLNTCPTDAPTAPAVLTLMIDLGVSAGDTIELAPLGTYDLGNGVMGRRRVAAFSSSDTLLEQTVMQRIPDMITIPGQDYMGSGNDLVGCMGVSEVTGDLNASARVRYNIPMGATHLFLGIMDGRYLNNIELTPVAHRVIVVP